MVEDRIYELWCFHNGILLINKMEELLIQATAWTNLKSITVNEKAESKGYTLYVSLTFRKRQNHMNRENRSGLPGAGRWNGGLTYKWAEANLGMMEILHLCVDCCDYTWWFVKIHDTIIRV